MSEGQPVIVSYLKLPPDAHSYLRLKQILLVFQVKLDHLTLALAVPQDPDSPFNLPPEVREILKPLRIAASDQSIALGNILFEAHLFATNFLELVDALSETDKKAEKPNIISKLINDAETAAETCETAAQGMGEVSQLTSSTIENLRPVLDKTNNSATAVVFTEENSQAVNEVLQATREGSALFRQISQYYIDTAKHFRNEAIRSNPPSPEEIDLVRQRWTAFMASSKDLRADLSKIGTAILLGPKVYEARRLGRLWSRFGKTGSQTPTPTPAQPRAILDANASEDTPSSPARKVSVLRSIWQWLLKRCSTKKHK